MGAAMAIDEKSVFLDALALADAREREPYLQEACAGHPELLARLRELLSVHDESQGPLDRGSPALGNVAETAPTESSGMIIGPYKLIEQIGEGGMGTVWMARQAEPVKRLVALKLIKAGMDSKQVVARFEAERQALALMDHANIARVLDAGTTSAGRPYFVMDLVKGVPITRYCDEHHRSNLAHQDDSNLAYDLYLLAMSHHQLGQTARARDYYDWAHRWMGTQNNLPAETVEELDMFRTEAEQLMKKEPEKRPD
jgi:hypothetical protein